MYRLFFIIPFLIINSINAETVKMSFGGKQNIENTIEFPNNQGIVFNWTSSNTFTSIVGLFGSSECTGTMELNGKGQISKQFITCKGIAKNGFSFWTFHDDPGGDLDAEVNPFKITHGTGPFEELVGARCLGALRTVHDQNYYLFDASCNVTKASYDRMVNFKYD